MSKNIIKRTVGLYYLEILKTDLNLEIKFQEEIQKIFENIFNVPEKERCFDLKVSEKIMYLHSFHFDDTNNILNFNFVSAKYNESKVVINTETLEEKGILKQTIDGDKEYTHFSIKFEDNGAIVACEMNYMGISISKLITYLNEMKAKLSQTTVDISNDYIFTSRILVNDDFIEALNSTRRITLAKLYVDKEILDNDEFKTISGRTDVRDEVCIDFKPVRGGSLTKESIMELYEKKNKNNKIKRIKVDAEEEQGAIKIDTECIKIKKYIKVERYLDRNEIKSESIYLELKDILNKISEDNINE